MSDGVTPVCLLTDMYILNRGSWQKEKNGNNWLKIRLKFLNL